MEHKIFYSLVLSIITVAGPVWAARGGALENYREQFRSYREARTAFELAREKYLKLGTLAARDEAVSATKEFLGGGVQVLESYLAVLRLRVGEHPALSADWKSLVESLLAGDVNDYDSLQGDVAESETLVRLESISEDLDLAYEEKEVNAQFANTALVLADLRALQRRIAATAEDVRRTVEEDPDYPGRKRILGEWYEKITNKLEESARMLSEQSEQLQGFTDLEKVRDKKELVEDTADGLEPSRRLNLEVVNHLLEIVRAKKY